MPLFFVERIARKDLQSNREALFVFGDNERRIGLGGQAKECRGEPNAVGVATKRGPSMVYSELWFDTDYDRCVAIIDQDMDPVFKHLNEGGVVVFPMHGIGTGLSQLPRNAPKIMEHIRLRVRELKHISNQQQNQNTDTLNVFSSMFRDR